MRALIFQRERSDWMRAGRTERSLRAAGATEVVQVAFGLAVLAAALRAVEEPIVLAAAGAWLFPGAKPRKFSQTKGTGFIGLGAVRAPVAGHRFEPPELKGWARLLQRCGGDVDRRPWYRRRLPRTHCCYLDPQAARCLALHLEGKRDFDRALSTVANDPGVRAVHLESLDVAWDPTELRILQLITTIQIGGAERVALDLAEEGCRQGMTIGVAVFGAPTREAFPEPPCFRDLSRVSSDPDARAAAVERFAAEFGADVIHAHLVRAAESRAIRARGLPVLTTLHNMPNAWPAGMAEPEGSPADLLVACSQRVESAAASLGLPSPVRTVWNGIAPCRYFSNPSRLAGGAELRAHLSIRPQDLVLLSVANPRRQKRLDRLPGILAELRRRDPSRGVHLLLAGAEPVSDDAAAAVLALEEQIDSHCVASQIHALGSVRDLGPVLAAADVLVNTSEFEGLSLAQMEALAAGLPIVATRVGGTSELAEGVDDFCLVESGAPAESFARAIEQVAQTKLERVNRLPSSFTRYRMTRRYRQFYPVAILQHARRKPRGLLLITNNFSTGGAQSSARRLLQGVKERGFHVRAAVVQEQPEFPTAGRNALTDAGIDVFAVSPPEQSEVEEGVEELLGFIAQDPPEVVVFWNLITSYKVLLADQLVGTRVYDVSPGEMYFESLAQYFHKPRPGVPYLCPREYGARLAGLAVKFEGEVRKGDATLGTSVEVIRNGVQLCPTARSGRTGRLILGTSARLSPQKRLEDLIEAMHLAHPQMPPYVLRIAGAEERSTPGYARKLRRLARGLPVEWVGEVSDICGYLSALDLFVMISEPAGCPNASLEAMASGLPVVATDVGGAREQVRDGWNGRLVPRGDAAAYAGAVVQLSRDRSLREEMGANSLVQVRDRFSLEEMVSRYVEFFGLSASVPAGERDLVGTDSSSQ